ncbi:phosphatidate cytidylyltransferase [Falsarthrobacter nasiphocae]|uniref:Phosphatidate cytidylyltransferase n=1 Tax=Falsarthrobacter nasiphocae TaxID=189863 RepID=A0AAE3YF20_9MICC|nr:phosphatidate cytidylyltransferase [Falsarthrobacter nasiphocae]MDR6892638.1 phosphatidate cytidylyltransferase [Falsarthrobacter nasiphocae]
MTQTHAHAPAPKNSKAGRDLPAAIGVGVGLGALVLVGVMWFPPLFVVTCCLFAGLGVWEVCRALRLARIRVPQAPLFAAAVLMPPAAYAGGEQVLTFVLVATAVAVVLVRAMDPEPGSFRAVLAAFFVLLWVPFFISFALLLMHLPDGKERLLVLLLLVVANDTFGYIAGVRFGRHPMAPTVSPKKSWEGFAGSVVGACAVGVVSGLVLLNAPWWFGVVLGVAVVIAATSGDLAESMVKRELGMKDMSNILPGHGGVMDRLDSMVFGVVVVYAVSLFYLSAV